MSRRFTTRGPGGAGSAGGAPLVDAGPPALAGLAHDGVGTSVQAILD